MPFATAEQVAARMGRDAFTGADLAQVNSLLDLATGLVVDAVDKTDAWATALGASVPAALKSATIEAVVRVMFNPAGARSTSETLGAHSYSQTYADATSGLLLTEAEVCRARRAVYGQASGSVRIESMHDDLYPAPGS